MTAPAADPATLSEGERGWLTAWFETYLTHDRFKGSSDAELAALLAPTVEAILAARLAAVTDRDAGLRVLIEALADDWETSASLPGMSFQWRHGFGERAAELRTALAVPQARP